MTEFSRASAGDEARRARQIVDGLHDGFLSLDADERLTDCNLATERLLGRSRQDLLGRKMWEFSGVTPDSPLAVLGRRVAAKQASEEAEIAYPRTTGERLMHVQVFPLAAGIGTVWRDITEVRAAELRLAESEAQYRELADGTPAAAWLSRADGSMEFINQAMADTLGRPREALLGEGWMKSVDPEHRASLLKLRTEARATHSTFHYEGRFRHADGGLRIIEMYGRPRFDKSGGFNGHVGMATDVTEVRKAARQQKLLVHELNHRVKNTLSTVQSLVRQTLRAGGASKALEILVTERLLALSSAHDVLTRANWEGAELAEVARGAIKPFDDGRITYGGPAARVGSNVAVALSLALHELATNALKHGALSKSAGRVRLTWTTTDKTIALEWCESGGPPVTQPTQPGFGTRLLGRGMLGELGAAAELIYAPEGVICRLLAPLKGRHG